MLPGTDHQRSLLRLRLMSNLIPDKFLYIFPHNPAYERDGFRMWGRILERYDPQGKDALFERVSALYTLEQSADNKISSYMSRDHGLFSFLHGVTFNTMTNLFILVNSDRSQIFALDDCFCAGDPEVVNVDVDRLETLLGAIKS